MEETFRKFCVFYAAEKDEKYLEELKQEAKENTEEYQKKALKFVKNLKYKAKKLGYNIDFESFCNLLEEYISKKDDLEDKEKRNYLKVLFSLSKIYEVNLREELEKYVSYKKVSNRQITERDIFKQFCFYNLNPNNDVSEFNRLTSICNINNLNFDEINQNSLIFVEEIKMLLEKIGYSTSLNDVYKMIKEYQKEKKNMDNTKKAGFLKLLFYLCEIYNLNLRELITKKEEKTCKNNDDTLKMDPLTHNNLLTSILRERYESGLFQIENFNYHQEEIKEQEYNYNHEIASLAYNIFQVFIDKFNNYAYDDLNQIYSSIITEEDINRLNTITLDELEKILNEEDKHESKHYICKKFKLPETLYNFINRAVSETIDLKTKSIGIGTKTLFNLPVTNNSISIYLNGSDKDIIEILKTYIKKCLDNNLNYELDGLCYDNNTYKTIIYSNKKDFKNKINILKDIINDKNISSLVEPLPFSCHDKNNLYSISRRNITNKNISIPYITYINNLLEVSYYRTISKIVISKVDNNKDKEIINNIVNLVKPKCSNLNPLDISFNKTSFNEIKNTINNYIPLINNTLSKYIKESKYNNDIIEEFKKAIYYISNIIENKDKKLKRNITIE